MLLELFVVLVVMVVLVLVVLVVWWCLLVFRRTAKIPRLLLLPQTLPLHYIFLLQILIKELSSFSQFCKWKVSQFALLPTLLLKSSIFENFAVRHISIS